MVFRVVIRGVAGDDTEGGTDTASTVRTLWHTFSAFMGIYNTPADVEI